MLKRPLLALTRSAFMAAAIGTMASPAFAASCPLQMKAIDAALAGNPSISSEMMTKVKELRTQGAKQHKNGQHAASLKSLEEAKTILGL